MKERFSRLLWRFSEFMAKALIHTPVNWSTNVMCVILVYFKMVFSFCVSLFFFFHHTLSDVVLTVLSSL